MTSGSTFAESLTRTGDIQPGDYVQLSKTTQFGSRVTTRVYEGELLEQPADVSAQEQLLRSGLPAATTNYVLRNAVELVFEETGAATAIRPTPLRLVQPNGDIHLLLTERPLEATPTHPSQLSLQ